MSQPSGQYSDDVDRRNPDFSGEAQSRDMRTIDDKNYPETTGAQADEDFEEEWPNRNQSPLAGRMSGTMEELERIQSSEHATSDEIQECLRDSLECYQICVETASKCLTMGGRHAEPKQLNLLLDCAKICSTNADFILRNSTYSPQICGLTADICDECADSCDRFEEDFMKECASMCRRCSESCREMAR